MRLRLASALLGVGGVLCACGGEPDAAPAPGRPVSLARVVAVDLEDRVEATGELLAKEEAEIAAEVAGRVSAILADEGAALEAGEVVLAIDPERRQLELESARARVDETRAALREQERELARVAELHERNVASATQLDEAETDLKLARSRLLGAEAQLGVADRALRDANVTAPFSGRIARRFVSRGEFVSPGQKLFDLVSLSPIEVEFHLTEIDSGRVRPGQTVKLRVAPYPEEIFEAVVTVVSPTIDPRTRTLRVQAELDNEDLRLRPGLFARVDLGIATRPGVAMIPEEAILQRADGAVVFRVSGDNRVERLVIETGVHRGGSVEIVEGLEPGDVIVSRGHSALVDGELVVPRRPDGTPESAPASGLADAGDGTG